MPINIITNELTAEHKREVRKKFDSIYEIAGNYNKPENFKFLIGMMVDLKSSPLPLKKELSNYLLAICTFLNLPKKVSFDKVYENQLFVAILYFMEQDDVIPDHTPYIGLLDDAFCVNYALTKQSTRVKDEIEGIVRKLENT
jgi:hypothetical protein